jgi:two-component system sensor histidine kinase RstB
MRGLFLKLSLGIAASILLASLAAAGLFRDAILLKTDRLMAFPAAWAREQVLERGEGVAAELSEELGFEVSVVALDIQPAARRAALAGRERVTLMEGRELTLLVALDAQRALVLGPLYHLEPDRNGILLTWLMVSLAALVVAVGSMVQHLWRQLQSLDTAAQRLGQGELDARAAVTSSDASGDLAASFNQMAERLEGLVTSQQELLWAISHDLRTPLARLRFALALLEGDASPEQQAERIAGMEAELDLLDRRVGEVLEYARLQGQPLTREQVSVEGLLRLAAASAAVLRPDLEVSVSVGEVSVFYGSRKLLTRALENLVTNAARYAKGGIWLRAEGGERLRIVVEDDGPGVAAAERERIFEPYCRLGEGGGSGLGLAIVRRIVGRHGGEVWMEEGERGALFVIELPAGGMG